MSRKTLLFVAVAVLAGCGTGAGSERTPQASVADTLGAQRDFREIHRRWSFGRPSERGKLEPALRQFLERYPEDRHARMARVYLAWIWVQRGQIAEARKLVAETRGGPTGSARDFAAVAEAAILLREGKPDQALGTLRPLDGKLIDPEERFLYGEQRVLSALAARREGDALGYMLDWLAQAAPDDRDAVRGRIHDLIQSLGPAPLEKFLPGLAPSDEGSKNPDVGAARHFMLDTVSERLIHHALDRGDAELARRLLDSKIQQLRRGENGAALARIAARGSVVPRVAGRSLGLLLSSGTSEQRRRSAQVVAGVSRALGLPASASDPEAVQLVTSDESGAEGALERALAELAGEGAVILVAGVDEASAARAARYANDASIPVMLLADTKLDPDGYAFELGVGASVEKTALDAALEQVGVHHVARVGRDGVSCDVRPTVAGLPRFPVQDWQRDGIDGLAVLGDSSCARDAARELGSAGRRAFIGLGLECGELFDTFESQPRVALSAGSFPERKGATSPEDQREFVRRAGRVPSWYASLGHDAAALARDALASFALEHVDDARVVDQLHRDAFRRLKSARAVLWSSDEKGFDGSRTLQRKLVGVSAEKGGALKK